MKILIVSSIDPEAIDRLRQRHTVACVFNPPPALLREKIKDCEVIICRSGVELDAAALSCAPRLGLIVRAGSGFDNLDLDYIRTHHLKMVRIPGPGAQAVAEMTFALLLGLARRVVEADRLWRQGRWVKNEMIGNLLTGKTLGIVGCGNIGTRVGQLGVAWGMQVLGCVDTSSAKESERLREKGITLASFEEVLTAADYLTVHVPLQNSTRYLINATALAAMKPTAYLVNMARGGVVEEAALLAALQQKRLAGAALDVHEQEGEGKISPLAGLSNVILTPHLGAMAADAQREIGRIAVQHIEAFAAEYHRR